MKTGLLALMASVALCMFSIASCNGVTDEDDGNGGASGTGASGSGGTGGTGASGSGGTGGTGGSGAAGGTGGSGGAGAAGGTGGTGGAGAAGGTGGSGGAGAAGGTGGVGGAYSCAEVDIPGVPNFTGDLSISPLSATFDDFMTVLADVDEDTREVTALLLNASTDALAGFGFASTSGNETVEVTFRVETTAQPGLHVLEIELRGDPPSTEDYILYTPGDDETYVRIEVENGVLGPPRPRAV